MMKPGTLKKSTAIQFVLAIDNISFFIDFIPIIEMARRRVFTMQENMLVSLKQTRYFRLERVLLSEDARYIDGPFSRLLVNLTVVEIVAGFGELTGYGLRFVAGR